MTTVRFTWTGAVAGMLSAVGFAAVHALLIGDIWWSVVPMAVAGVVCGASIAWSFGVITPTPTQTRWALYNATHAGMLVLLGIVSMVAFEPITSIPLLRAPVGGSPVESLVVEALPMTIVFGLASAVVLARLFGHRWWHLGPVMVAMAVVITLLGLDLSILGLIEIPRTSPNLVSGFFVSIAGIVAVYAALVAMLGSKGLRSSVGESRPVGSAPG